MEVYSMIVYHNILGKLASCGWPTTKLQKERLISNGTIIQIRAGRAITTTTIDTICRLCSCQPGDLISYVPDPEKERQE
jgi:putative transcriptional regulator